MIDHGLPLYLWLIYNNSSTIVQKISTNDNVHLHSFIHRHGIWLWSMIIVRNLQSNRYSNKFEKNSRCPNKKIMTKLHVVWYNGSTMIYKMELSRSESSVIDKFILWVQFRWLIYRYGCLNGINNAHIMDIQWYTMIHNPSTWLDI